jgi:hypothetical protein
MHNPSRLVSGDGLQDWQALTKELHEQERNKLPKQREAHPHQQ